MLNAKCLSPYLFVLRCGSEHEGSTACGLFPHAFLLPWKSWQRNSIVTPCLHTYHFLTSSEEQKGEEKLLFCECFIEVVYLTQLKGDLTSSQWNFLFNFTEIDFISLKLKGVPEDKLIWSIILPYVMAASQWDLKLFLLWSLMLFQALIGLPCLWSVLFQTPYCCCQWHFKLRTKCSANLFVSNVCISVYCGRGGSKHCLHIGGN